MELFLMLFLVLAMVTLFFSGYFIGVLRERHGKSWIMWVPACIAVFMFNIIWAITEMAKSPRWH
ncbi:hypothetical protein HHO41_19315 [Bacillus sp. DNRA2]|nr:hypothetical protein [Bacillus sp. DNRA2]